MVRSLTLAPAGPLNIGLMSAEGAQPESGAQPELEEAHYGEAQPSPHIGRQSRSKKFSAIGKSTLRQGGRAVLKSSQPTEEAHYGEAEPSPHIGRQSGSKKFSANGRSRLRRGRAVASHRAAEPF